MTLTAIPSRQRIFRVSYRTPYGKLIKFYCKVPYGGLFTLAEVLTRAVYLGNITMFSITIAKPKQIARVRATLQRWPEALRASSKRSGVSWIA